MRSGWMELGCGKIWNGGIGGYGERLKWIVDAVGHYAGGIGGVEGKIRVWRNEDGLLRRAL